jgi:LPXTG-motif cell wall-anchored protein
MKRREVKGKVKQILQIKGKSLSVMLMVAALAAMLVGLLASTPASAYDPYDWGTGCDWASAPDCSLDSGGAATGSSSPSPTPTASPTASPSASPTASPTASAAQDQYQERPDTEGKAVAPAQTTEAKQLPNTGGLPETNRNSSMLPLVLGSSALLVGGGLLARRLIR